MSAFDLAHHDSDATSVNSLPSFSGTRISVSSSIISDWASQMAALCYLNSYLTDLKAPFSLQPPLPSGQDSVKNRSRSKESVQESVMTRVNRSILYCLTRISSKNSAVRVTRSKTESGLSIPVRIG